MQKQLTPIAPKDWDKDIYPQAVGVGMSNRGFEILSSIIDITSQTKTEWIKEAIIEKIEASIPEDLLEKLYGEDWKDWIVYTTKQLKALDYYKEITK